MFGGAKLILFVGARLVVLERDYTPGIPWPGCFDLPGGGREGSESAEACVLRETHEEIGLLLSPADLAWRTQLGQGVFFAAHLPEGHDRKIQFGGEGVGWLLMTPDDFIAHPRAIPHFAQVVRDYIASSSGALAVGPFGLR